MTFWTKQAITVLAAIRHELANTRHDAKRASRMYRTDYARYLRKLRNAERAAWAALTQILNEGK